MHKARPANTHNSFSHEAGEIPEYPNKAVGTWGQDVPQKSASSNARRTLTTLRHSHDDREVESKARQEKSRTSTIALEQTQNI